MAEQMRNPDGTPMTIKGQPVFTSNDPELMAALESMVGVALPSYEQWQAKKMTEPQEEGVIKANKGADNGSV